MGLVSRLMIYGIRLIILDWISLTGSIQHDHSGREKDPEDFSGLENDLEFVLFKNT
jgi:hypothetical protein